MILLDDSSEIVPHEVHSNRKFLANFWRSKAVFLFEKNYAHFENRRTHERCETDGICEMIETQKGSQGLSIEVTQISSARWFSAQSCFWFSFWKRNVVYTWNVTRTLTGNWCRAIDWWCWISSARWSCLQNCLRFIFLCKNVKPRKLCSLIAKYTAHHSS